MKPTYGKWLNATSLKNMKNVTEVISPPAEVSKEDIHNRRIPLNDFPIFSKPYSMDNVVKFLDKCHVDALLAASEAISHKKKRKTIKKHSERTTKKFKTSIEHLETSSEQPRASRATSARTPIPFDISLITTINSSSIPPKPSLHISQPHFHALFHLF